MLFVNIISTQHVYCCLRITVLCEVNSSLCCYIDRAGVFRKLD